MARVSVNSRAVTHYGPRAVEDKLPSRYSASGGEEVMEWVFSYDDLPAEDASDAGVMSIPANAFLKEATIEVITAFAGGTSYNFGLYEADGSVIDADGIDAAVALSAMNAIGETVACDGALVASTAGIGTAAGLLRVAASGTYTAGKARLILRYIPLLDRA